MLLVGTSSGEGWMWKIPSGDCKTFQGHNSRNTCAAVLKTGKMNVVQFTCMVEGLLVLSLLYYLAKHFTLFLHIKGRSACFGYEDGAIKVWDLKEGSTLLSVTGPSGHTGAVTCMAAHQDNVLLLSGSDDSTAKLTNINSGKVMSDVTVTAHNVIYYVI